MTNTPRSKVALFADVAQRYCSWAEGSKLEVHADMVFARKILAELHLTVLDLPDNCPDSDTEDRISHEMWKAVSTRFSDLPIDGYWDVFDPLIKDEPVFNTLRDDLSDIYRDLKEGLLLYGDGKIEEAIWEWRFNFTIHWGAHLTGAQRVINAYFSNLL